MVVIPLLVGVVSGVGANLLSDLTKRTFARITKNRDEKTLKVQVIEQPNGNSVIVVMQE